MKKFLEVPLKVVLWCLITFFVSTQFFSLYGHLRPTEAIVSNAIDSVVLIQCRSKRIPMAGLTAGFIMSNYGHIITVSHGLDRCVSDRNNWEVFVVYHKYPDILYKATILRYNKAVDLAILQVPNPPSEVLPLKLSKDIFPLLGSRAIAIGHPFSLYWTVSSGIVTRNIIMSKPYAHYIQIDSPINHGSSGGPVFNDKGEVIGIVKAGVTNDANLLESTFGIVVPSELIRIFYNGN